MSALTDLFTSMANKIRSKVGGSDTYTPTEMVSAIDDVYDAGVADATTPITPSNSSPVALTADTGYKPTDSGYAIKNYFSATPSNASPVRLYNNNIAKLGADGFLISSYMTYTPSGDSYTQLTNGNIYKMGGDVYAGNRTMVTPSNSSPASVGTNRLYAMSTEGKVVRGVTNLTPSDSSPAQISTGNIYEPSTGGYAIESYDSVTPSSTPTSVASGDIVKIGGSGVIVDAIPTPASLTPSDSSPVAITSGTIYKADGGGYAIESQPSNKTPDDTTPPSVSSGEIVKMGGAGYLYATQHSGTETTLWTNNSPTSAFSTQDVTLSQDYTNFKRIKFEFRGTTTDATSASVEYLKEDIDNWAVAGVSPTGFKPAGAIPFLYGSQSYMRLIRRTSASSASSFSVSVAYKVNSAGNTGSYGIPTKIVGIN